MDHPLSTRLRCAAARADGCVVWHTLPNPNVECLPQLPRPQVTHVRKVVKFLSLSQEQLAAMPESERQQVAAIRHNAVHKMKMAHSLHGGPAAHIGGSPNTHMSPLGASLVPAN